MEPERRRPRPGGPDPAQRQRLRRERLLDRRPAPAAAEGGLPSARGDDRQGRAARAGARRRRRLGDARVGDGARRDPLHALVPAAHGLHRREARLLLRPDRRRQRDRRVLGQGADPGRAGRVLVPERRHPLHVRGPRLHRVGPVLAGLHPREPERRAALHPDGVHLLERRGAGQQDPAAALDGRPVAERDPRADAARRQHRPPRLHDGRPRAGVLPDRRAVLLRAPRPRHHRPHAVRRQAAEGPGARRPLLRLDPRARAGLHARDRAGAGQARRADQDPPQRGRAGPVRGRADLRELQRRLRPPAADDADHAERRPPLRARLPAAREALRRHQRLGQAQQLVDGHRHGHQPARPGRHAAREPAVPVLLRGRHPRGQPAPGAAARLGGQRRPGPPPRRQRGPAGDHLDLPRRRAGEGVRGDRVRQRRRGHAAGLPRDGRLGAPAPAAARRRPQPHVAVRLHRQQVRVPRARLLDVAGHAEHDPQHDRGRVRRPPGRPARRGHRRRHLARGGRARRSSRTPGPRTSGSSSPATTTPTSGTPRPRPAAWPTCASRPTPCPG